MMTWGSGDVYSWNPHLNMSAWQGFRRRFVLKSDERAKGGLGKAFVSQALTQWKPPCPFSLRDWQWKDLESGQKKTAHDCVSYSGLFRLIKEKKIIIAECGGEQKAAMSPLVTVRETVDAPRGSVNNLLTLLWKKATYSLRWSYVVLIIEHH